jgi:diguanylate cyclase (GGDEF)-like protein/PAS domain S-box-containing protein
MAGHPNDLVARSGLADPGPSTEELPAISAELRALLDVSADAVLVVDGRGRIAALNQRLEALFALPAAGLLGHPVERLLPERHRRAHVAERGAYSQAPAARAMSSRTGLRGLRGDGGEFPVEVSLTPIIGSAGGLVMAVVRDVTSRVTLGERASVSTAALDAIPDSIFTTDISGNVEFLNHAAEALTGWSRRTARGRPLAEILPLGSEHESGLLESPVAACLRRGSPEACEVLTAPRPGGERLTLDLSATPMRDVSGAVTGMAVVARDVTHARLIARELAHQATHDPLTGLVNRREFERRLGGLLAGATGHHAQHALCFLDLDGFKGVNDGGGHGAGDELLCELSRLMRRRMRGRDTLARLGGDEFGLLLEHCGSSEAERIAGCIRRAVHNHRFTAGGRTYRVGASIGLVSLRPGMQAADVLGAADAACYAAKRAGGNQVQVFRTENPGRLRATGDPASTG